MAGVKVKPLLVIDEAILRVEEGLVSPKVML